MRVLFCVVFNIFCVIFSRFCCNTMDKKRRLRAPNFTNSESILLCDIISKYKHIIECKKTDGASLQQKQKAWVEVLKEFNSVTTGYSRTLESLQQNYKNLKKRTKKHASSAKMDIPVDRVELVDKIAEYGTSSDGWKGVANSTGLSEETCQNVFTAMKKEAETQDKKFKKYILCTGGGPPPKFEEDSLLDKVKGLVGPAIDGMYTIYDGDSSLMASQSGVTPIESKNIEELSLYNIEEEPVQSQDKHTEEVEESVICFMNETEVLKASPRYLLKTFEESTQLKTTQENLPTQDEQLNYFTNNRNNLKKSPHHLLNTRKRRLDVTYKNCKETVTEKFKCLAGDKQELVGLQKQLIFKQIAVEEEKLHHYKLKNEIIDKEKCDQEEKIAHNRALRALELEESKKKVAHSELLRKRELENLKLI